MDYNRTKEQLLTDTNAIKGESTIGANTADRIGGILHDIVEHLDPNLPDYTTYNLLPTPSVMQFGVDPTTNEFTPTQIPLTCRIEKRVGNGDGDDTVTTYDNGIVDGTDLKLYYKKYFSNGTESIYTLYSGSITVAAEAAEVGERVTSVNFYLAQQADGSSISGLVRQVNVPVVRTGKSSPGERGEPALRLNMSNDMDAIPCNSDKVVPVQTDIKTVVSVYLGSEIQKGEGIVSIEDTDVGTIEVMREGVSYSVLGIVSELGPESPSGLFEITWTFDAGDILTSKKYQVPITVNYNGTPYHATFIVVAVEGLGTMQLLPNPTQITFANGEEDVKKYLKLDIQKKEGSDIQYLSVSDSGLNVRYSFNSMPNDDEDGDSWIDDVNPSNGLEVSYANTSVYIAAFNSEGILIDRETVPVLTDGADGNLGRFYYFAGDWGNIEHPENLTVNENQAPYVRHSDGEEVKYYMCISPNNTGIADDTPDNNPSCWTEMEQLDYAIHKAVFSDYAELGAFIIKGNLLLSQKGLWSSDNLDNSESGATQITYSMLNITSDNTIYSSSVSEVKYTFINTQHPEKRVTNEIVKRTITGQIDAVVFAAGKVFEAGELYDISHEGISNCNIYLRYYYSGSSFNEIIINSPGSTHSFFEVQTDTTFDVIVKPVTTESFTCTNLCLDIRNFSPNVVINGVTGQVVLNNVYTRGTVTGTGIFDNLFSKEAHLYGLTEIEQPQVNADYPEYIPNESAWVSDYQHGKYPILPKYKKVAIIEKDAQGFYDIREIGTIEIESSTGYLKYTQRASV